MKKILLLFTLLFCAVITNAQSDKTALALQLVTKNSEVIGLSKDQLSNIKVSSTYYNDIAGTQMVYLLQTYKGLPVYNQMLVLAFKDEKVVSNAGAMIPEMEKATNHQGASPSLSASAAVSAAFAAVKLETPSLSVVSTQDNGHKIDFGRPSSVSENVTAELMWIPSEPGNQKSVRLAWQVQVFPLTKSDMWYIQIDAITGSVINKVNLTVYENKGQKSHDYFSPLRPKENLQTKQAVKDFAKLNLFTPPPPPTVTNGDYRVLAYPVESPNFGSFTTVNNPWLLSGAGNNATTNGWHFDGTTNYDWTRGNNVFAYLDVGASNAPNAANNWPDTSTTPNPSLTFTQVFDPLQQPGVTINKKAALNNLFYWNNLMHDVFYQYGFNEINGNFQADNLGRGGLGSDYVQAECQDGGGTNNANFGTPVDGGRPRMQMYLWDPANSTTTLHVNAPGPIVGDYVAVESAFSPNNLLANVGPKTGDVVYFNDGAGTHDACTGAPTNVLTGKIALINRGNCNFTVKVLAAQAAGAIAVIMINNVAGAPIIMGGGPDPSITIPAVMISQADGAIFVAQLSNGLNATMSGTPGGTINLDGDLDNGIVCHEFGHGISNRLTGGPGNSSCLGNAEQGGEGWSDFQALMMTTNWATAGLNDGFTKPRPVGTYAFGQQATGAGIRNYPYCTNIAVNPLTYANMGVAPIGTEVHNTGEIWCMALWEMTWSIIQQTGTISPNIFDASGTGGNVIAMKLEIEGMRLQPCSPGFIDARNAILTADQNLYGGAHLCAIWAAFAKRGMGYSASQGSSFSATDQTAATNLPPIPSFTVQPADVSVCAGSNTSFTVTATGYNLTYNWQVSTDGGATWNNVSPAVTTATLNLTGVTGGMNNYKYRCVVSGGCPNTAVNSNVGTLTVNTASPTISSQPVNTSACAGTDASFSITVPGSNTYNWQVSTDGGATWNNVVPANTTTTLTLTAVTLAMTGYQYRCQVTGGCPTTTINSNTATLTVTTGGLSFSAQPSNTSACAGANASFSVTAVGATSYNWQVSTDGGATWTTLSPAVTTATLNLTGVTAGMNNNQYHCVINGPGACTAAGLTSNAATLTVNNPIAITSQPVNASVCTGNNATFSITVTGASPTYNWQVSTDGGATWNDVSPAVTTAILTLTGVTAGMNNNQYRCQVAGTCTAVAINSNAATLTINTPPSITAQPANTAACVGSNASFSVTASGSGLSYNWQVSTDGGATWNSLTPAVTTATLTLTGVTAGMNNNQYRCVVSISCNPTGVNSNAATLTVNNAPAITAQPTNTTVCEGTNASFCVTATGFNLTYQWQVNTGGCSGGVWVNVVGGTSACLTVNGVTAAMNNYAYQCIVSGGCTPSVTSTCGTLTVNTAVVITAQPVSTSGCTGGNASFSVTATGTGLTYNWQVSTDGGATWNNVSPAVTTATLTLTGVTAGMNNNQYRCQVGGTCSAVPVNSNAATLTLSTTVSFTTQPASAGVCAGTDVTFTVAAVGTGLGYNWQVSTNGGTTWANVSPVNTTNTLTIVAPTVGMSGYQYRCVASGVCNPAGVNSSVATLTVNTSVNIVAGPTDIVGCTGSAAVFTATVTGNSIAYQWQVSVNGGPFVNLTNAPPYSGVNTNTLTINPATGLNNTSYRLNASGAPCGGIISSNAAILDVKTLPVVVLTAASYTNITPYIRTTLYTTVSPPGNYTYQWFRDGVLVPSITADRFAVTVDDFGTYEVVVTDVATGCSSKKSNTQKVDFKASDELFIYPNPSSGQFQVRYLSYTSTVPRTLNVFDSKGARVYTKVYTTAGPYTRMDVNLDNAASDVYLVEVRDNNGKRLASGKVVIK